MRETAQLRFELCAALASEIFQTVWEGLKFEGEQPTQKSEWCVHERRTSLVDQFSTTVMPTWSLYCKVICVYHFSSVLLLIFCSWLSCETLNRGCGNFHLLSHIRILVTCRYFLKLPLFIDLDINCKHRCTS
jgi:hypothetical protein